MKTVKAFTLIELLVVVAIISLLVSILLPSLQKARDLAKDVLCLTNLNGLGKAVALYASDYDDEITPGGGVSEGSEEQFRRCWMLYAEDYAKQPEMYKCPHVPNMDSEWTIESRMDGWDCATGVGGIVNMVSPGHMVSYTYYPWGPYNPTPRANNKMSSLEPTQKVLWDNEWYQGHQGPFHTSKVAEGEYGVLYADQSVNFVSQLLE